MGLVVAVSCVQLGLLGTTLFTVYVLLAQAWVGAEYSRQCVEVVGAVGCSQGGELCVDCSNEGGIGGKGG